VVDDTDYQERVVGINSHIMKIKGVLMGDICYEKRKKKRN